MGEKSSGGNNKLSIDDYIVAMLIITEGLIGIDPCDCEDAELNVISTYSKMPSPEEIAIKKDLFEHLSQEAKEIINTILYSPEEVYQLLLTPKKKRITKKRIRLLFQEAWKSQYITELAMEEISRWVKQL